MMLPNSIFVQSQPEKFKENLSLKFQDICLPSIMTMRHLFSFIDVTCRSGHRSVQLNPHVSSQKMNSTVHTTLTLM
ncbi:hypothetical protein JTE90_018781 [Oedothorax gibbosus]|uniref:Uncharacterized protein n=1 Tax=Oedothorax gibbosus TaxID=931172 RepID=A0AAV6UAR9_9ARAC|nr:hypothetical protein JTE90_018781 [Oedothorax gibbosus]